MFLFLQNNGFENLDNVQEDDIYEYFLDDFGNAKLSRNICVVIKNALKKVGNYCDKCRIISDFIPLPVQRRKNYQFLTKKETNQIRSLLLSNDQELSYRDKAIAIILFYTGIRAGDLANLRFSNINWSQDLISIFQNKTKEPLELPLLPMVGNAIYDYLEKERPNSQDDHIFLMVRFPHRPLRANALWGIANKIFDSAAIRKNKNDKRGTHIFRHRLATHLAENGVSRPIISSTLGHSDPTSLNHYLSADIENLRQCALSIEQFPVKEGLYK